MSTTTPNISVLRSHPFSSVGERVLSELKACTSEAMHPVKQDALELTPEKAKNCSETFYSRPALVSPKGDLPRNDSSSTCLDKLAEAFVAVFESLSSSSITSANDLQNYQDRCLSDAQLVLRQEQLSNDKIEQIFNQQKEIADAQAAAEKEDKIFSIITGVLMGVMIICSLGSGIMGACLEEGAAAAADEAATSSELEACTFAEETVGESTEMTTFSSSANAEEATATAESAAGTSNNLAINAGGQTWKQLLTRIAKGATEPIITGILAYMPITQAVSDFKLAKLQDQLANMFNDVGQPMAVREMVKNMLSFTQSLCQRKTNEPTNLAQMTSSIMSIWTEICKSYRTIAYDATKAG